MADPQDRSADWQILGRHLIADRSPYARMYDIEVRLPDGNVVPDFVRVEIQPYSMIFAVLKDERVPMVWQYRLSIQGHMLELPAGLIEPGEEPLAAAKRELREETGVEAADWHFLGKYVMDANKECGWGYMYLAQQAEQVTQPDHGDLGEMTLRLRTLDEVRNLLTSGTMVSGPAALCIGLALSRLNK